VRENHHDHEHPRVIQVHRLKKFLQSFIAKSPIANARRLVGIPQPNNVLLHDGRYQALWQAYLQLVRQQMLEDSVWRWRHRLFAEESLFCVIAALHDISDGSICYNGDVLLRLEQTAGRFIDSRTHLGSWQIQGQPVGVVDVVLSSQLDQHLLIPQSLKSLSPDFVLIRTLPDGHLTLSAVWSVLDFNTNQQMFDDQIISLAESIAQLGSDAPSRALLIQPCLEEGEQPVHAFEEVDRLRGVRVTLPLQQQIKKMADHVAWALKLS
jgi:hypothetical protein